ncbi:MAG: GYD domain-containing protein [Candidatus Helarchaeales archaeon]
MMIFISLINMNESKQEEAFRSLDEILKNPPEGVSIQGCYFLLGEYDALLMFNAPSPNAALKLAAKMTLFGKIKTLTAVPFSESKEDLEGIYWYKKLDSI